MTDQKQLWWIWSVTNQRLSKWALALLQGRHYTIRLQPEGTGFHSPVDQVIQVNPQLFPEQPVEVQFRLTQGLLAHECGHAWFTGDWPEQSENILQELTNILEDERIERGICTLYPGVMPAVHLLGDLVYSRMAGVHEEAKLQAYGCCLAWRWAHSRTNEAEMFRHMKVTAAGQSLWGKIRPLVEQAWTATDTAAVISLTRDILHILGLPPSLPRLGLIQVSADDIPTHGARSIPFPPDPSASSPGLGTGLGNADLPVVPSKDRVLQPAPYLELEGKVRSYAACLAEALKEPSPEKRPAPHEYSGRYSFRQEIRTPDTPHLALKHVGQTARNLALYVLVDRSGSMCLFEQAVRQALMTIYLAAVEAGIPIGISYFGEDDFRADVLSLDPKCIPIEQSVAEVAQISRNSSEAVKALIAGYTGWSSKEYLDWGLRIAEAELRLRPERLHVLLIIHDGEPVFQTRTLSDWDLSLAHLRVLERAGVIPIGVHLGKGKLKKLNQLFPRLVNCPDGEALPEKLGRMLRSLA
jgi:hypothetical protein